MDSKPEELPAIDDHWLDQGDHPDEVSEEEALEGLKMYRAIDDLDDESNGVEQ